MHIIGLLDAATSGRYELDGVEAGTLSRVAQASLRSRKLGFVFQAYNLLARTSAVENVELPLLYAGVPDAERRRRASAHSHRRAFRPPVQRAQSTLRRTAAAGRDRARDRERPKSDSRRRADRRAGHQSQRRRHGALSPLDVEKGITILLVTHDPAFAAHRDRLITFRDGAVISDERNRKAVLAAPVFRHEFEVDAEDGVQRTGA